MIYSVSNKQYGLEMNCNFLSTAADVLGIFSFLLAAFAFYFARDIRKKVQKYKIMESFVIELEKIYMDLAASQSSTLIPKNKKLHLGEVLAQIKNYHIRSKIKVPDEVNDCIELINSNPNCTKGGVSILIRSIIINIQISPELVYALK